MYEDRSTAYNARFVVSDGVKYDLTNYDDLEDMKIPSFQESTDTTSSLDYILRMCASNYRNRGQNHLSIAILAVATKMMIYSNIRWSTKDFKRIVYWLIEDGRQQEADNWEQFLNSSDLVQNKGCFTEMDNNQMINRTLNDFGILGSENEENARMCWNSLLEIEERNKAQADIDYRVYLSDKAEYIMLKESASCQRKIPRSAKEYQRLKYNLPKPEKRILESDIEILSLKFRIAYLSNSADIIIRFRDGSELSEYCWWVLLSALQQIINDPESPRYFQDIKERANRDYTRCKIPKKYHKQIEEDVHKITDLYYKSVQSLNSQQ